MLETNRSRDLPHKSVTTGVDIALLRKMRCRSIVPPVRRTALRYLVSWLAILVLALGVQAQAMPMAMAPGGAQAGVQTTMGDLGDCASCANQDMTGIQCDTTCLSSSAVVQPRLLVERVALAPTWAWSTEAGFSLDAEPNAAPPRS